MRRHVDALYTADAEGLLLLVNDGSGGPAPRFLLARTPEGCVWRFGAGLSADVAAELDRLCRSEPPAAGADDREPVHRDRYFRILGVEGETAKLAGGPCYALSADATAEDVDRSAHGVVRIDASNAHLLEAHLPDWTGDATRRPMVAALDGGHAVSVCASVRITDEAHEAGVDTAPAFRRRGFAHRAAAAWLAEVGKLGVEPLYSTSWKNEASQRLAASLGLTLFGSDLAVF